jgi:predicted RNA-binding protein with PIN domain
MVRKLPADWAVTMCRVVDTDDTFRSEVASAADEEDLGRLAWLWLTRPEGWRDELDGILTEERRVRELSEREQELTSRLDSTEKKLDLSRRELEDTRKANDDLLAESDRLRKVAGDHAASGRALQARISELEAANKAASSASTKALERVRVLEGEKEDLLAAILAARVSTQEAESERDRLARQVSQLVADKQESTAANRLVAEEALAARRAAAGALVRVLEARATLEAAIDAAADELGVPQVRPGGDPGGDPGERSLAGSGSTTSRSRDPEFVGEDASGVGQPGLASWSTAPSEWEPGKQGYWTRAVRRRLDLPPAILDDSPEAAGYLVRAPGAVLIVDGYNVALTSWPGVDLPSSRDRLVSALAELAVRVKIPVSVYFDGNEEGGRVPPPAVARPWLKVYFSASSREADEDIVSAIEALDQEVAVVVATDDGQVRSDSGDLGANVISVGQLLAVLGRRAGPSG